ncbi:MAG: F0F1 ATP synthase subunit B [Mariprofundaceae bacterium]
MSIDLTFVGQIIVFLTMVYLLKKNLYGPLNDAMEARTKKIAEGLAAAEAGNEAKVKAAAEIDSQLAEARTTAQGIVSSAEKRAAELGEESSTKARVEAQQIVDAAREEVAGEANKAREALRSEVASIAMLAAERVIDVELDTKRHAKLVEGIVSEGFGRA